MDTTDLIGLDQLGLADPTPQSSPDVLSYANSQLTAGKSPDDAMQATLGKYGEGNPFSFSYNPDTKQFTDDAVQPTTQSGSELLSLDSLNLSAPLPATKPVSIVPAKTPNSTFGDFAMDTAKDLGQGIKNVGQDITNAGLDIGQYFSNFSKEHETFQPNAPTEKEKAAAKFLGISLAASPSSIPGLDILSNPTGLGRGSVYKLSPDEQKKLAAAFVKSHGGNSGEEEGRLASTYAGQAANYDPFAAMVGDDPFIKALAYPRLANTQKYYLLQNTVQAMDVSANPSKYSPEEVKQAKQFLAIQKEKQGASAWKGLQDTWQKFKTHPTEAVLGMAAGMAQNPAVLAAPEAKLGSVVLGERVSKTAEIAQKAEELSKAGVEAAPGASDFAQSMGATATRRASQFSAIADRAKAAHRALGASQRVLDTAGAGITGAAINAGTTEVQESNQQGFVRPGDLISPAAIGAIIGSGLSVLRGGSSTGDEKTPVGAAASEPLAAPGGAEGANASEETKPAAASFIDRHKGDLIPLAAVSGIGSLAATTLSNPSDSLRKKLEYAGAGSLLGLLGGMDMFGRKVAPNTELGTFAGRRAQTFTPEVKDASSEALRQFYKGGESPERIHELTGIYVDPEGNPMHEVTDHNMEFVGVKSTQDFEALKNKLDKGKVPLNEVVKNSGFQKAYPDLANEITIHLNREFSGTKIRGSYDPRTDSIALNPDTPESWQTTILHEMQHAVQAHEGWPEGSSRAWFEQILNNPERKQQFFGNEEINQSPSDLYQNTYGEELARETADRQYYSEQERADMPPLMITPTGRRVFVHGNRVEVKSEEHSIADHLSKTGELDEDGKLRGMVLREDKLPNEPDVVSQAKEGNQQAIGKLYQQYMPRLTRTLATLLRGKTGRTLGLEAEDIAHIAFTKAIQALPNFRGDSSFYTYLYTIARNSAYEALNRSKRAPEIVSAERPSAKEANTPQTAALTGADEELLRREHPMGPAPVVENIPDTSGTPEEHAVAQQTSNMLNHVLSKLPEDIRNTVKLVHLVGMSYEEAAQALGVPIGTIRSRLHNAEKTIEASIQRGHGAQFRKQAGFATPEALQKLLKTSLLLGAGAYVGSKFAGPDHKLRGEILGAIAALRLGQSSPREMYQGVKYALSPDNRIRVNYLLNDWDARRASMDLLVSRIQYQIDKLAPSKESQKKITYWLDGDKTISLTPKERQAANLAKSFYDKVLQQGLESGILKDFLQNYVNHEWLNPKMAEKLQQEIENSFPTNMSPKDKHALARKFLTLQKGKEAGLIPKTENVNGLIAIYGRSMARAMANKALLEGLKAHTIDVKNGIKAVMPATKAPYNFVAINHPQLAGVRVAPDIAPSLRYLFHQQGGGVISALEGLNIALKREETGLSLFHPYALSMAFLTANPFTRLLDNFGQLGRSFVGKTRAHTALLSDGTNMESFIQGGIRNGLKLTLRKGQVSDEDVNTGFYQGLSQLQNFLEKSFPLGGKVGEGVKQLYKLSDKLVWEDVHTGLKGITFMNAYERLLRNNQESLQAGKIQAMPTKDELYRQAASFTNDIFGGLNWRRLADDATTRVGRLIGLAVSNPLARRIGQVLLFAPDWTYSTIRSFVKAFGPGSGVKGVLKPKGLADLHRQYLLRNAIFYFTLYNGLNMALSGKPIWENKDPLTVDMGGGERLSINKHFMEVPHAIENPGKFALGKMGTIPSEALEQALKVDYLNPGHMPPMKGRVAHLAQRFEPFFLQALQTEGPKAAMLGLLGAPVYGGHRAPTPQEAMEKKQRKEQAAKKAAKTRESHEMEKLMRGEL